MKSPADDPSSYPNLNLILRYTRLLMLISLVFTIAFFGWLLSI